MLTRVAESRDPVGGHLGAAGGVDRGGGRPGEKHRSDAARQAFEDAGYRVVGTSISGQAARTLGAETGSFTVRTDDGRTHTLGADQIGPDKLAHGYATTVHRSQGATFDTAHLYANGGGRELEYVAMSRARQTAHVHAVADNVYQAVETSPGSGAGRRDRPGPSTPAHPSTRDGIQWRSKPTSKPPRSCEPCSAGPGSKPNERP
jgi:hypothetical protein